jgi:TfoX/Sxy family transcriptional regulator of competence genes
MLRLLLVTLLAVHYAILGKGGSMAYDERLAEAVRERLAAEDCDVVEKKMFGGLGFMVEGNLTVAASRQGGLLVRTDPDEAAEVEAMPGVESMEMRGHRMPGWVFVAPEALSDDGALDAWVGRALEFVADLPPK